MVRLNLCSLPSSGSLPGIEPSVRFAPESIVQVIFAASFL
jgi:hypothetical protein